MAKWIIKQQDNTSYDIFWEKGSNQPEGPLTRCTVNPQDLNIIHQWLLEPTQAGFCDTISYGDGRQFFVMAPADS